MNDVKIKNIKDSDELIRVAVFYAVRYIATGVAGFFSAVISVEGLSPFGVAFVSSIFPSLIPSAVFGAILGYFHVYGVNVLTLRYISACAVAGILSYLLKRNLKRRYHVYFSALSSFFTLLATGLVLSLSVTVSSEEVMLYTVEGAMGGTAAWFVDRFLSIKPSKRYISRLSGSETASVLIVFGLILMALSSFDIYIFSPAVVLGSYAGLVASSFGGGNDLLMVCSLSNSGGIQYYTQKNMQSDALIGHMGALLFDGSGSVVGFVPESIASKDVIIGSAKAPSLTAADGTSYRISSGATVIAAGETYPYTTSGYLQLNARSGSTVRLFYDDSGVISHLYLAGAIFLGILRVFSKVTH